MSRKSKRKILFGLKVLAVCGAAVFMMKGVIEIYTDAQSGISKKEEVKAVQEAITSTPDAAVIDRKEKAGHGGGADDSEDSQGITRSMEWDPEDAYLLAKIAMAEAEGEGVEGKALVILVVRNRVWSDKFPDSISGVIFQDGQFSPVSDGRYIRVEPDQECYEALDLIQLEKWDGSHGALYFESASASDWHRNNLKFLFQYGEHYFYKDKE